MEEELRNGSEGYLILHLSKFVMKQLQGMQLIGDNVKRSPNIRGVKREKKKNSCLL